MNIREVKEKYCTDKKQTGQLVVLRRSDFIGRKGVNVNNYADPETKGIIRSQARNWQGKDPLSVPIKERNKDFQKLRTLKDFKGRVITELKSMLNYAEKLNDVRSIKDNIERIYPRLKQFMESEVK